jgi:hypothetical protein
MEPTAPSPPVDELAARRALRQPAVAVNEVDLLASVLARAQAMLERLRAK